MKKLAFFLSVCVLLVSSHSAFAQKNDPPYKGFGLGVYATTFGLSGVDGVYAINPNIQVGSYLSFSIASGGGASSSQFQFAPFFRYVLSGTVSPFFEGGLSIGGGSGSSTSALFLGGGFAYYLNEEIGMHAGVFPIVAGLSPSGIVFGVNSLVIGADWFF